jgi:nucleoside-diphosphate-sugar epimerase
MKVGVVGANGQVGSGVCLLLHATPGVEVVPVCRNPSGSAFLRWHGLACRHGLADDAAQAFELVGDCDVVANFALAVGRPSESRERNRRLIENVARASPTGAKIVYFSTLAVYRSFKPAGTRGGRSAYGDEKLRCERDAKRAGRRTGKATWVLRLGHVCGQFQGIREELRRLVAAGPVVIPRGGEYGSNLVHTVTVADALIQIAGGRERPGTYDLLSVPDWSWKEVLSGEADALGAELHLEAPERDPFEAAGRGPLSRIRSMAVGFGRTVLASPRTREMALSAMGHLPESFNLRAQAQHYRRRARMEIAELVARPVSHDAFAIQPLTPRPLESLSPTASLLTSRGEFETPTTGLRPVGD